MTVSALYAPSANRRSIAKLKAYIETTNNLKAYVENQAIAPVIAAVTEWGSRDEQDGGRG